MPSLKSRSTLHPNRPRLLRCLPPGGLALLLLVLSGCSTAKNFNRRPNCLPCEVLLGPVSPSTGEAVCPTSVEPFSTPHQFRNLVFEGGGVKGAAYGGAFETLAAAGRIGDIERVAGTSAGAANALMFALGYSPAEIRTLTVDGVALPDLVDGSSALVNGTRLFRRFGWYRGDGLQCYLECLVEQKLGDPGATFADLEARLGNDGFRELWVVGTDLSAARSVIFSHHTFPDMPLAEAVRVSMGIPLFFPARQVDVAGDPSIMVDGSLLLNYPIDIFDEIDDPGATLGFQLGASTDRRRPIDGMTAYTTALLTALADAQVFALCRDPDDVARTVFIDPGPISATAFDLTAEQKCELVRRGAQATQSYLEQETPARDCPSWLEDLLVLD